MPPVSPVEPELVLSSSPDMGMHSIAPVVDVSVEVSACVPLELLECSSVVVLVLTSPMLVAPVVGASVVDPSVVVPAEIEVAPVDPCDSPGASDEQPVDRRKTRMLASRPRLIDRV